MKETEIEQEIQEKGLAAARVTLEDVHNAIVKEAFFTAADGIMGAFAAGEVVPIVTTEHTLLTFCVLTLRNGFTVTGESACVSPENFDAEIGRKVARENARQKIWSLEGYLLKQKLYEST